MPGVDEILQRAEARMQEVQRCNEQRKSLEDRRIHDVDNRGCSKLSQQKHYSDAKSNGVTAMSVDLMIRLQYSAPCNPCLQAPVKTRCGRGSASHPCLGYLDLLNDRTLIGVFLVEWYEFIILLEMKLKCISL
eukprot:1516010-Amphidinium_carterae.1